MTRVYVHSLLIATVLVSVTGAYFSISGLTKIFAGATLSVALMAGSLEFSKFIVVGFLYRYYGHIHKPLRLYLTFAVVTLMGITSVGIYGYLSHAYQVSSLKLQAHDLEIKSLEKENERIQNQITELRTFIDQIPNSRISRKFEFQKSYDPKIAELRARSEKINQDLQLKNQQLLPLQTEMGPVVYLAKVFGASSDTVVKYLILVFVLVFDPLAVSLVFCLNLIIRLKEKYRGNEFKIGARSLTSPVDHRNHKRAA